MSEPYIIKFGIYKGLPIELVGRERIEMILTWLVEGGKEDLHDCIFEFFIEALTWMGQWDF